MEKIGPDRGKNVEIRSHAGQKCGEIRDFTIGESTKKYVVKLTLRQFSLPRPAPAPKLLTPPAPPRVKISHPAPGPPDFHAPAAIPDHNLG